MNIFRNKKKAPIIEISKRHDLNRIGSSMDKARLALQYVTANGNSNGVHTWNIILNKLQIEWDDAMIELKSGRSYHF